MMIQIQILLISATFIFSACNTSHVAVSQGGFYHSGIYFGKHLEVNFQQGIADGCTTSKGYYRKSHYLFNRDNTYYNGWFLGRKKCRDLLKINENGDLVL